MGTWGILRKQLTSDEKIWLMVIFCHFCLVNFISHFAMTYYPNTGDEFAILFQAKIFSLFDLTAQAPAVAEVFESHYLEINQGKWFSQYPPIYSLMITPGVWIGYPLFIVSIFSSCTLFSLCSLLKKVLPENSNPIILIFLIIFGFSPLFLFHSASYYNHIGALFIYSMILHNYLGFLKERKMKSLIWISCLFGLGVGIRPYTFFLLSSPLALGFLKNRIFEDGWKKVFALILPFITFLGLLLLYNYNQSCEWNSFSYLKAGENASKLSLSHFNHASFSRIFTMVDETFKWLFCFGYFSTARLNVKSPEDINFGFLLFLPIIGYLISKLITKIQVHEPLREFCKISLFSILVLIAGHIFYDFRGGRFGERFFFEITWMLVVFLILIVFESITSVKRASLVFLIFLLPGLLIYVPNTILSYKESNIQRMDLFLKTQELQNAVIHVGSVPSFEASFYTRNHPELEGVIYVLLNRRLIWDVLEKFPSKKHYIYNYHVDDSTSRLVELQKE